KNSNRKIWIIQALRDKNNMAEYAKFTSSFEEQLFALSNVANQHITIQKYMGISELKDLLRGRPATYTNNVKNPKHIDITFDRILVSSPSNMNNPEWLCQLQDSVDDIPLSQLKLTDHDN